MIKEQKLTKKTYVIEDQTYLKNTYTKIFKYDFKIPRPDTKVKFKLSCEDKYLY